MTTFDDLLLRGVSFDLETHLVQPGLVAPPPVCGSTARWDPVQRKIVGKLLDKGAALATFMEILDDPNAILVGQNIQFDVLVMIVYAAGRGIDLMPRVFALYDQGRVYDIGIAEQLHAVAMGTLLDDPRTGKPLRDPLTGDSKVGYRLSVVVDLVLGRADAKLNDRWRGSYAQLEPHPIELWPYEAKQYPVDDACNTLEVALAQVGSLPSVRAHEWHQQVCRRCRVSYTAIVADNRYDATRCAGRAANLNLHNLSAQCYADLALHLGAAWGFLVNPASVDEVKRTLRLVDDEGRLTPRGEEVRYFVEHKILRPDESEDKALLMRLTAIAYGATGKHEACDGTGQVVTKWSKREPIRPLAHKQCVECSATGLDLSSSELVPLNDPSTRYPTGSVQTGRDALYETGDDLLIAYAAHSEDRKLGTTYVPWLETSFVDDGNGGRRRIPLTLRPHVLLETGRTSYSGLVQLLPRRGGIRQCIEPRPRRVFSTTDYEAGELITHAQSCLWIVGESALATALLNKVKPHNALGAQILGIDYDEFNRRYAEKDRTCVDVRQACKPANFGFPGRMGPVTLVKQQRKQGPDTPHPSGPIWIELEDGTRVRGYKGLRFCLLMTGAQRCGEVKVTSWGRRTFSPTCKACIEAATWLREGWLKRWPENEPYFAHIEEAEEAGGMIAQHVSKRLRTPSPKERGVGNSLANGYFQGLLADLAKDALCAVTRECYVPVVVDDPSSQFHGEVTPLYRSVTRIPLFAHDELIGEHDDALAHEGATRIGEIMVGKMREWCPDLAPAANAEPALMTRWYKSAAPIYHDDRLVPWEPSHNAKTCGACAAQKARDKARKQAA